MSVTKERLRQSRKLCGFKQDRMANVLGYSYGYYCQIESGAHPIPKNMTNKYILEKITIHLNHLKKTLDDYLIIEKI